MKLMQLLFFIQFFELVWWKAWKTIMNPIFNSQKRTINISKELQFIVPNKYIISSDCDFFIQ